MISENLPPTWRVKPLAELCKSIQPGFAQGTKNVEGGIIHLRMNNIGINFELNFDLVRKIKPTNEQLARYRLNKGDVIFNNTNSSELVGKSAIFNEDGIFLYSNHLTCLRPDSRQILSEWLLYYLRYRWMQRDFERICKKWINQAAVSSEKIQNLDVPTPPIETQNKIVGKLQSVLTSIEDKKKEIRMTIENNLNSLIDDTNSFKQRLKRSNNLEYQLLQSVLQQAFSGNYTEEFRAKHGVGKTKLQWILDAFRNKRSMKDHMPFTLNLEDKDLPRIPEDWLWTNIGSIAIFIGSGITPKGGKSVYVDKGVPFIRSQNVRKGKLDLEAVSYITPLLHEKMSRTHVRPLDVLLNITGASIGRSAWTPSNFRQANVNQHVCIIRTDNWVNAEYLSWWLNSSHIQNLILAIHKGETREGLNYRQIRALPFPLCATDEQNSIVSRINEKILEIEYIRQKTHAVLESYNHIMKYLDYLPRVILQNVLSGKLTF